MNKFLSIIFLLFCVLPLSSQNIENANIETKPETSEVLIPENTNNSTGKAETILEEEKESPVKQELFVVFPLSNYDLNPHTANYSNEMQILSGLYEGLFTYDPRSLEPTPGLVDTYKVSRNKLSWKFTLKENLTFSDGTPITAQIIRDSFLKLLSPETNAPYASLLECIQGVQEYRNGTLSAENVKITASDSNTLVIKLKSPTEHLPKILCMPAFSIVSPTENVFSGAFILVSKNADKIEFSKNQNYWDKDSVKLEKITFYLSEDEVENTFQFNAGNIHWVSSSVKSEHILTPKNISIGTQFGTEYFFFTNEREPWNNPIARNALLYAVPWDELRANHIIMADTFIMQLMGYPSVIGFNDYDLDYALEFFEEAGLKGTNPNINIAIPDTPYNNKLASILKTSWEQLGINVTITPIELHTFYKTYNEINADLLTNTWIGDFPDPISFLELFRGNSSLNRSKWNNLQYNELLESSSMATGTERYEILSEAEQLLLDDGMIIPISHPVSFNIVDFNTLKGWYENPLDIHPFKYMYIEKGASSVLIVKQ